MVKPGQSDRSVDEVELEEIGKKDSNKASGEEIPEGKEKTGNTRIKPHTSSDKIEVHLSTVWEGN